MSGPATSTTGSSSTCPCARTSTAGNLTIVEAPAVSTAGRGNRFIREACTWDIINGGATDDPIPNGSDCPNALGTTLSRCAQADVEKYLNTKPAYAKQCSAFVRWAVRHRYAKSGIKAPAKRWTGPAGPHDEDGRWALARRLLHDETLPTADRVAGLLVLLYAQSASSIHRLTTDHVTQDGDRVLLHLGPRPLKLPAPLDALVRDLVTSRSAGTLLRTESHWLFPGRSAGQPLHESLLQRRLNAIGIKTRQGRSTALFALTQQVPAGLLSKMLGVHISVAVAWQRASGGDRMGYAADVAARTAIRAGSQIADAPDAQPSRTSSTTSQV